MRHPELLIPAGSLPVLKVAVHYGADAVYIGGEAFGLREKAVNFTYDQMKEGISFAHKAGVKVYVTANIFAHNADIREAESFLSEMAALKPDGILVSDPGMLMMAKRLCPDIPLHISTQANTTNYASCLFWRDMGAERVVLARELTLEEIREIRSRVPDGFELEAFVHGAMCVSYSGRCLLSNYLAGRDANHGACTHPCRWNYAVMEETRPGEYMPVEENDRGTFVFNSKDLCMVNHLPDLYAAGIDSFKVEGRMKTALYVAVCARTYRIAMDDYSRDPELYRQRLPWYMEQISACTFRHFTTGFFYGKPGQEGIFYEGNTYVQNYTYLGTAEGEDQDGRILMVQKNKFSVGDTVEIMKADGRNVEAVVKDIYDDDGSPMASASHASQLLHVGLSVTGVRTVGETEASDGPEGRMPVNVPAEILDGAGRGTGEARRDGANMERDGAKMQHVSDTMERGCEETPHGSDAMQRGGDIVEPYDIVRKKGGR